VYLQGADAISTGRILEAVVRMCYEAKQFDLLNENIIQLTKKRGQLKQVIIVSDIFCHLRCMLLNIKNTTNA